MPLPDSVLRNGQAVSEPEQVMECWRNAFLTLYQPAAPTDPAALEFQQRVDASLRVPFSDLSSDFCGAPLTGLECAITEDEVSAAIRHMCSAAAPGPDSVPAWVFKDGAEAMVPALTVLFNDVWEHRVWPSDWTLGWICPIFKKGARSDPDHYRGITLLPHYDKLLKSVMRTRLSAVIESRRLLSPFQAGFRAEYGTMDHVLTLNEIATSYYERDAPLFLAFLDVSKAYDHTARNLLWYRLRKIGVTDKVLAVWRSSYDNVRRAVRVNEEITCEFACESGVAQGAVDSPTLYDVFIDELSALLLRDGFGVGVGGDVIPLLMYADDIVLLASSAEQLQRMLLVVERFAVQFQFAYNHAKSGVVVVATPALKASFRTHQWMLAGAALPVLDFYKYLGVEFGRMGRGRWNDLLTRMLRGLKGKSTELLWANGNRNGFAPLLQMSVWNALCRPLVEYGCVLWHCSIADDRSDALEVEQLRFAKNTLGVAQSTPTAFVRGELDLPSLASHRDELTLRAFGETMSGSLYPASRDPLSVRLVTRVVRHRMRQARAGQAPMSWCTEVKPLFRAYDLLARWYDSSFGPTKEQWRETCAQAVAKRVRTDWLYAVHSLPTLSLYRLLKSEPAPERYTASLNREGRYLKLQLRAGMLPLMDRLGALCGAPYHSCERMRYARAGHNALHTPPNETPLHFVMQCEALRGLREQWFARVRKTQHELVRRWFDSAPDTDLFLYLCGGSMPLLAPEQRRVRERARRSVPPSLDAELQRALSDESACAALDQLTQNFLVLAWRERDRICGGRFAVEEAECALVPSSVSPPVPSLPNAGARSIPLPTSTTGTAPLPPLSVDASASALSPPPLPASARVPFPVDTSASAPSPPAHTDPARVRGADPAHATDTARPPVPVARAPDPPRPAAVAHSARGSRGSDRVPRTRPCHLPVLLLCPPPPPPRAGGPDPLPAFCAAPSGSGRMQIVLRAYSVGCAADRRRRCAGLTAA